ncbi:hypothetical protein JZ751_010118, partial [Albula glossodonta]
MFDLKSLYLVSHDIAAADGRGYGLGYFLPPRRQGIQSVFWVAGRQVVYGVDRCQLHWPRHTFRAAKGQQTSWSVPITHTFKKTYLFPAEERGTDKHGDFTSDPSESGDITGFSCTSVSSFTGEAKDNWLETVFVPNLPNLGGIYWCCLPLFARMLTFAAANGRISKHRGLPGISGKVIADGASCRILRFVTCHFFLRHFDCRAVIRSLIHPKGIDAWLPTRLIVLTFRRSPKLSSSSEDSLISAGPLEMLPLIFSSSSGILAEEVSTCSPAKASDFCNSPDLMPLFRGVPEFVALVATLALGA